MYLEIFQWYVEVVLNGVAPDGFQILDNPGDRAAGVPVKIEPTTLQRPVEVIMIPGMHVQGLREKTLPEKN